MKIYREQFKRPSSFLPGNFLLCFLFIFIMLLSVSLLTIAEEQEDFKKSIQIINPRPDFSLSLRLDKGTGATYVPGERIRIYFRASKDAYVTLFGYDTRGNIRLLFPNRNQKDSFVEANRQYYIDGIIERDTPAGFEYVQGFATTEPRIISRELERRLEEENFPILEEGVSRFNQRIREILRGLSTREWVASEILHYQVMERREEAGRLRVTSNPSGAEVYLGDRHAGKTPLSMDHVRSGEYVLRVELSGYRVWSRTIQVNPNRTTTMHAGLEEIQRYGSIAIRCNENNAGIYVNNQYRGVTDKDRTIILDEITPGFHDIRITLSGYLDWTRRIEVKPGQRIQLNVNLERETQTGNMEISCDVDNALIYLDGNYQGRTSAQRSIMIRNLEEGTYELRIAKEGYQDYLDTIRIYADHSTRINVKLQREYQRGSIAIHCNENNAKIFMNGIYQATTMIGQARIIDELRENVYEITIIKDGYHTWLEEVWVYPGETASIFADLVKIDY